MTAYVPRPRQGTLVSMLTRLTPQRVQCEQAKHELCACGRLLSCVTLGDRITAQMARDDSSLNYEEAKFSRGSQVLGDSWCYSIYLSHILSSLWRMLSYSKFLATI